MMMKERQEQIKRYIERKGEVSLIELAAEFSSWSEMTIRRDLEFLEQHRFLIRTKRGARIMPAIYEVNTGVYGEREKRNNELKQEIAIKAASMIDSDISMFLDAGTTAMAFARHIPDRNLIVITSSPNIGIEIAMKKEKPTVIMLGGTLSRKTMAISGLNVLDQLKNLNIDTAFMCTSGYTQSTGFSVCNQHGCVLKQAVVAAARRVVMLMDSTKICSILPYTFARITDIDTLVTDSQAPESLKNEFRKAGVKVI